MPVPRATGLLLGLAACLGTAAGLSAAEDHAGEWFTDFAQAVAKARETKRPMLVHFHADWCGPCRRMEREVLGTPEVVSELRRRFVGVRVDGDKHPQLLQRFGVRSLPADALVSPEGDVVGLHFGYQAKALYLARLDRVAKQYGPVVEEPPVPDETPQVAAEEPARLGLDGYSPVSLWNWREWRKGKPEHVAVHQGVAYHLLGCDPVVLYKTDQAVPGTTKFGAYFDGALYLFTTPENRAEFKQHPNRFVRTRHVLRTDETPATEVE
jgi:thiol-disulfide isomerase/thioredoxin/YHS domain-containing protein